MNPKVYELIQRCVEDGVSLGWRRAHKHTDTPDDDSGIDIITQAVLSEICEWFHVEPQ